MRGQICTSMEIFPVLGRGMFLVIIWQIESNMRIQVTIIRGYVLLNIVEKFS